MFAVLAVAKLDALLDVRVNALDAGVLVVGVALKESSLSLPHALKDFGFALVATVDTHAKQNLLRVGLCLEGLVETETGVCGGGGQMGPA